MFLERHFERVVARAALYRALDNSGVVDLRRDHVVDDARARGPGARRAPPRKTGPKDTEDLDSLARMVTGVISALRYAMIQTGKPTPAQAARLVHALPAGRHGRIHDAAARAIPGSSATSGAKCSSAKPAPERHRCAADCARPAFDRCFAP